MRGMEEAEIRKVLMVVANEHWKEGFIAFDEICYGGDSGANRAEKALGRVLAAFPKDIIDAYNAELRKAEADKLRSKADAIERGKASAA